MSIALPYALRVVRRKADSVPERGDQILYLALEILYIAVVIKNIICQPAFFRFVHLRLYAGANLGFSASIALLHARHTLRLTGSDQNGAVHLVVPLGLEQQGGFIHDDGDPSVGEFGEHGSAVLFDQGMHDVFQLPALCRVAKDERAELTPVEGSGTVEHFWAQRRYNGGETCTAWRHHLSPDLITRNHREPMQPTPSRLASGATACNGRVSRACTPPLRVCYPV
jgi:hypothetical protein